MLSDLYVPADTDPASPRLDGQLNDEDCDNGPQGGMEDEGGGKSNTDEKLCEGNGVLEPCSTLRPSRSLIRLLETASPAMWQGWQNIRLLSVASWAVISTYDQPVDSVVQAWTTQEAARAILLHRKHLQATGADSRDVLYWWFCN